MADTLKPAAFAASFAFTPVRSSQRRNASRLASASAADLEAVFAFDFFTGRFVIYLTPMPSAAPRLKYRNTPTTLGGLRFASKAEAKRYGQLVLLEKAGQITGLLVQPRFPLKVNGMEVCTYVADFLYYQRETLVVEDVKSNVTKTSTYRLKAKLMRAVLGIDVKEIDLS